MSIKGDFTQIVNVGGLDILVSNLSIREGTGEPIAQIDFSVDGFVNSGTQFDAVVSNAPVIITQTAQGRTIIWHGTVSGISAERHDGGDVLRVNVFGETEKLARIRFTDIFEGLTASAIVVEAIDRHASQYGIDTSGVMLNDDDVGIIIAREDTVLDVISRVASLTDWAFRLENNVLHFFDPRANFAPFDIASVTNLGDSSLRLVESLNDVRNVIKAEAFEYKTVIINRVVNGCVREIYGETHTEAWEFAGDIAITSPDEIAEADDLRLEVDLFSGRVGFSRPLYLPSQVDPNVPLESQEFTVNVEYTVRRKLLLEKRDLTSIGLYGERHSIYKPGNGGDDVESVFLKLQKEIDKRAYPLIVGSCDVVDFGLRAGDWVVVEPIGSLQPVSMKVSNLQHTTNKGDLSIKVGLSAKSFYGVDAVPEIVRRLENLEKQDLNPRSWSGTVTQSAGAVTDTDIVSEQLQISDSVSAILAGEADIVGGGSVDLIGYGLGYGSSDPTGGGGLHFDIITVIIGDVSIVGGGGSSVDGEIIAGLTIDVNGFTI